MERIVIACYRPKAGMKEKLLELTRTHIDRLRAEQLVTDRKPVIMEAQDGTVLEVFEWKSKEAIESAHTNPRVQEMRGEYAKVCEYIPVAELPRGEAAFL